jgi:hypothetical protein
VLASVAGVLPELAGVGGLTAVLASVAGVLPELAGFGGVMSDAANAGTAKAQPRATTIALDFLSISASIIYCGRLNHTEDKSK